jgi:cyclic pyranopterin phosphate synthase
MKNRETELKDQFGREISYMRISITDRCNLRCRYCMPEGGQSAGERPEPLNESRKNGQARSPAEKPLSYDKLEMLASAAAKLGVTDFRVTGGEPLVREGCAQFIGRLKAIPGIRRVSLTTNGTLLARQLPELLQSGLDDVNVSLDALDEETWRIITGSCGLEQAREGIDAALCSGLPVKINTVLQKGINDGSWREIALLTKDRPLDVRFIELMPIGYGHPSEGVSNLGLEQAIRTEWPGAAEDPRRHGSGPARYLHIPGWKGSIGMISAMHESFCSDCTRIRLTADGILKPCLCYGEGVDLRPLLRLGEADLLAWAIRRAIRSKPKEHCFTHPDEMTEHKEMIRIGG